MTQQWRTVRPGGDEHAAYYGSYIAEVPQGDVLAILEAQGVSVTAMVRGIPEARGGHRYAEGKWSIKDVVLHLCDAERVFSYRLLRFARGDATDLPGFDEGTFVRHANADARTLNDLADEFQAVRRATLALITSQGDEAMERRGTANGNPVSARAIAWILAGHAHHHARILRERYL